MSATQRATALDPALAVTIVPKTLNTDAFATLVAVTAAEATVTATSGGHTDASQCADVAGAVAFVDRCTA